MPDKARFDAGPMRRNCSVMGWACFAFLGVSQLGSYLLAVMCDRLVRMGVVSAQLLSSEWSTWLLSYIPMYLLGFPCFLLVMGTVPAPAPPRRLCVRPAQFGGLLLVSFAAMYIFNFMTLLLMGTVQSLFNAEMTNPLETLAAGSPPFISFVFGVVIAPFMEELIFRGILLRRLRPYGEPLAIFASGLMFGMLHSNIYQILYGCALGFVLAYTALRTGGIHVTVPLHAIINLTGLLLLPAVAASGSQLLLSAAAVGVLMLTGGGVLVFVLHFNGIHLRRGPMPLSESDKLLTFIRNPGVISFLLLCVLLTLYGMFFQQA